MSVQHWGHTIHLPFMHQNYVIVSKLIIIYYYCNFYIYLLMYYADKRWEEKPLNPANMYNLLGDSE